MGNILMSSWTKSSQCIIDDAKSLGYTIEIIDKQKNFFTLSKLGKTIHFKNIDCGLNSSLALKIADDKILTYKLLEKYNLPSPKSIYIKSGDSLEIKNIGFNLPIIVKPSNSGHGNGVTTNISSQNKLDKAILLASTFSDEIIIQKQYFGEEYRVYVIGGKVVGGISRIPPMVIGDGINSIKNLILKENKNPLRGEKPYEKLMVQIPINTDLISFIESNGYNLDMVINIGEKVYLSSICNIGIGGEVLDITNNLSNDLIAISKNVAKRLGLNIVGIDFLTTDIKKELIEAGGTILEVNATPSIFMFYNKSNERRIGINIIDLAFKN